MAPELREKDLATYAHFIRNARTQPGCLDFIIAADPIEAGRVNLLERWESEEHLATFRSIATLPPPPVTEYLDGDGAKHLTSKSGPAFD